MTVEHVETRPGAYADSVTLMQVSAAVTASSGVRAALIAMATDLNLNMLAEMGFPPPAGAGPQDLLIAIRADDGALAAALSVLSAALEPGPPAPAAGPAALEPARTVGSAVRASGPGLALVSVPGQHAFAEAMDALDTGCDVMIFSDNMPVWQEIALKDLAARRGLLVMGPDCGTAVVGGVGLGFSHTLAPGPVGLVAASGTGLQQVLCLLDAAGTGVSAALGVGGRDMSAQVAGRGTRAALAALDADPATQLIVVVSKPPAPAVAEAVRDYAASLAKPVVFAFTGPGEPDLTESTEAVLRAVGAQVPGWPRWVPAAGPHRQRSRPGRLLGLFAGGTLCDEAMAIAGQRLGPIHTNIAPDPRLRIGPRSTAPGHTMIDFGDDELTAGRPHPMIDPAPRLERFATEAADPATGVIMLDVVLGHGSHPDPASGLAPAIAAATDARGLPVAVSLIGARSDPQGRDRQAEALSRAGAHVFLSNAQAARFACRQIAGPR